MRVLFILGGYLLVIGFAVGSVLFCLAQWQEVLWPTPVVATVTMPPANHEPEPVPLQQRRAAVAATIAERLDRFDDTQVAAAAVPAQMIADFFADRRHGCRALAKHMLSLEGKWEAVKQMLAEDREAYERFLLEGFAKLVFTPDELQEVLVRATQQYRSRTQGAEARLLVELQADIALHDLQLPELASRHAFEQAMAEAYRTVLAQTQKTVAADIPQYLLGNILSDAVAGLLVKSLASSALSGGILSSGAAASVATFGLSLVVSYVVDELLTVVLKELGYDPERDLTELLEKALDQMKGRLLRGDPARLQLYLKRFAEFQASTDPSARSKQLSAMWTQSLSGELGLQHTLGHAYLWTANQRNQALLGLLEPQQP